VNAGTGWDFANFYDAGHKVVAGQIEDLYNDTALIAGQPPQGQMAFYGTPLSAVLYTPLAWMSPAKALVAFKIQNALALFAGLWLLYRCYSPLARKAGVGQAEYRGLFLLAALLFQPFWTVYRVGGQTMPTVFLGLVLALGWFVSGRSLAAAICLVVVAAIKPAFTLMLLPLVALSGLRFLAQTALAGAAAASLSILAMGWSTHQSFLTHLAAGKVSPWLYNSSLTVVFDNLRLAGVNTPWVTAGAMAVRLAAAALVIAVLLGSRRLLPSRAARQHFLFLMSIAFGLFLMPVVWEHYLSVLFIPIAYLLACFPQLKTFDRSMVALICLACLTQNLILTLWLNSQFNPQSIPALLAAGLYKSVPLVGFAVLLWRYRQWPASAVRNYAGAR
jgi:hypothetical protein